MTTTDSKISSWPATGRARSIQNNGNGTFTAVTSAAGAAGLGWATSAARIDYDNDGRLDLGVARYMEWDFDDLLSTL
jgi:FG-GAP-like repeat